VPGVTHPVHSALAQPVRRLLASNQAHLGVVALLTLAFYKGIAQEEAAVPEHDWGELGP
jgi:hypothetical protein